MHWPTDHVIRVQPDEEWLAERVGRHVADHRDHIAAAALREFAEWVEAQVPEGYCCGVTLRDVAEMARSRADEMEKRTADV